MRLKGLNIFQTHFSRQPEQKCAQPVLRDISPKSENQVTPMSRLNITNNYLKMIITRNIVNGLLYRCADIAVACFAAVADVTEAPASVTG